MSVFLSFFSVGVFYSLLFPLFGGWFPLFLARFSTVQSLLFGICLGLFAVVIDRVSNRKSLVVAFVTALLTFHFSYWALNFSQASVLDFAVSIPLVIIVVLWMALGLYLLQFHYRSRMTALVLLGTALVLIVAKVFILQALPVSLLGVHTLTAFQGPSTVVFEGLYPFSQPLDRSMKQADFLLPERKPDKFIAVVILDALNQRYVGSQLGGQEVTPTLNAIAKQGQFFERYYVQSTWTGSSTATLFTGLYPHEHGTCVIPERYGQTLPTEYTTLAERLNDGGFHNLGATFATHLDTKMDFDQGFDRWISPGGNFRSDYLSLQKILFSVLRNPSDQYFIYLHMKGPHAPYQIGLGNSNFWLKTKYNDDGKLNSPEWPLPNPAKFGRRSYEKWLSNNPGTTPTQEQTEFLRHLYASQLNFYDRIHLGAFKRGLESLGLYNSSLLFLTGDHGESLLEEQAAADSDSTIRRFGHVGNLSESVINVPLIVKTPGDTFPTDPSAGADSLLESPDLAKTILTQAGVPPGDFRGNSFLGRRNQSGSGGPFDRALSEVCGWKPNRGLDQNFNLSRLGSTELRNRMQLKRAAYVRPPDKLVHDFLKQQTRFKPGTGVSDNSPARMDTLRTELRSLIDNDTSIRNLPGVFRKRSKEQKAQLRGLGYIE